MAEKTVYATKDDVQRWVKRVQFTNDTKVTISDVDNFITLVSATVDGELGKLGVTLPVPSTAVASLAVLKMLVSLEVASMAENAAFFGGGNKNESNHGKFLHEQYLALLEKIQTNPMMLSDLVTGTVKHMKSSTEDMNEDGAKEGEEIFTKAHIDDFRDNEKVLSPSEKTSPSESITGKIPKDRI